MLTKGKLDQMGCGNPDCQESHEVLYFHGRCHLDAPVEACYDKSLGAVVIQCAECGGEICKIAVAESPSVN